MKPSSAIAALVACVAPAAPAIAHDFWIEASPFQSPVGGLIRVSLHQGDVFLDEAVPRDASKIESFQMIGPDGAHPVMGRSGNLTSVARPEQPGLHVVAYHSGRMRSELPAEKFEQYLREKGLSQIAKLRASRKQADQPGREVYSRCAKALLRAGDGAAPDGDRALGLPLEIVAEVSKRKHRTKSKIGTRS